MPGTVWRQYEEIFPAINKCGIDQVSLKCANSTVPLDLIGFLKDKDAGTRTRAMEFVDPGLLPADSLTFY